MLYYNSNMYVREKIMTNMTTYIMYVHHDTIIHIPVTIVTEIYFTSVSALTAVQVYRSGMHAPWVLREHASRM